MDKGIIMLDIKSERIRTAYFKSLRKIKNLENQIKAQDSRKQNILNEIQKIKNDLKDLKEENANLRKEVERLEKALSTKPKTTRKRTSSKRSVTKKVTTQDTNKNTEISNDSKPDLN